MPLNAEYLLSIELPPVRSVVTDRDAMFYALSIGMGRDPIHSHDLRYAYEKDLKIFPTKPLVIGHPGNWMLDPCTGITHTMIVHGAQRLICERELPLVTTNRVAQIHDKGDKGAVMILVRETCVEATGVAAVAMTRAFPERTIRSFETRFSKPVIPGETITVDIWEDAEGASFRATVAVRNAVVLDLGRTAFQ